MGEFDEKRAENAVRELLIAVGEDPDREGLRDTPARVARPSRAAPGPDCPARPGSRPGSPRPRCERPR
ncbi:GTP cyclohydrolase I [Streptomyces alkaliphilus]|uniref:GTP cyclohydrolase I n=1 Tax=Streptomyces alkaliphilus TaxID=1472722 RepID=UPI0034D31592